MNNARINTLNGKPLASNDKTFGSTLSDRQTDPNILQTTVIPSAIGGISSSLQQYRYLMTNSLTTPGDGITPAITVDANNFFITLDLSLIKTKYYQLSAEITIILRPINNTTYYCGHWLLTSAAKDSALFGSSQYTITTITTDDLLSNYISNSSIILSIESNKEQIKRYFY